MTINQTHLSKITDNNSQGKFPPSPEGQEKGQPSDSFLSVRSYPQFIRGGTQQRVQTLKGVSLVL